MEKKNMKSSHSFNYDIPWQNLTADEQEARRKKASASMYNVMGVTSEDPAVRIRQIASYAKLIREK